MVCSICGFHDTFTVFPRIEGHICRFCVLKMGAIKRKLPTTGVASPDLKSPVVKKKLTKFGIITDEY